MRLFDYLLSAGLLLLGIVSSAAQTSRSKTIIGDNTATQTTINGAGNTGSSALSVLGLTDLWNTSGNPVMLDITFTNTASGATSKVIRIRGGASGTTEVFAVRKDGAILLPTIGSDATPALAFIDSTNTGIRRGASGELRFPVGGNVALAIDGFYVLLRSAGIFGWSSTSDPYGVTDLIQLRDAPNTLALRNSTSAQRFNVYGTYTDASNYRRSYITDSTGGVLSIGSEGLGTGATGNTITLSTDGTVRQTIASTGETTFANGFGSTAVITPVDIPATGWTNTFGVNAVAWIDGVAATYVIYNNAGTAVRTNVIAAGTTIPVELQKSGKFIVTAGTVTGSAIPK